MSSSPRPRKRRASPTHRTYQSTRSSSSERDRSLRRPVFPSYLDAGSSLSSTVRRLCEILATCHPSSVELSLSESGVRSLSPSDVESVLKLSYSYPSNCLCFFRWSSLLAVPSHSPYSWNLVADLLGKNRLFDAMWDHVAAMSRAGLVSLATFAAIFSSYAAANLPGDALAAFRALPRFGLRPDPAALNSLLSALCREGLTSYAREVLTLLRTDVRPDSDTFAVLLEGCDNEGDVLSAREVFDEMLTSLGWDPANIPAYDTFLTTLVHGGRLEEALGFLRIMADKRCYPGPRFFKSSLDEFVKLRDAEGSLLAWRILVGRNGIFPDVALFKSIIELQCECGKVDAALKLLDEMPVFGCLPNAHIFNLLLHLLLRKRLLTEAAAIIKESVRNECLPTPANLIEALKLFFNDNNWRLAIEVWRCVFARVTDDDLQIFEDSASLLVERLREMDMLPEACKYAEDIIDRGIKLNLATLSRLKSSLLKVGRGKIHERLLRKWKAN